jgi:hypothetical protein
MHEINNPDGSAAAGWLVGSRWIAFRSLSPPPDAGCCPSLVCKHPPTTHVEALLIAAAIITIIIPKY